MKQKNFSCIVLMLSIFTSKASEIKTNDPAPLNYQTYLIPRNIIEKVIKEKPAQHPLKTIFQMLQSNSGQIPANLDTAITTLKSPIRDNQ